MVITTPLRRIPVPIVAPSVALGWLARIAAVTLVVSALSGAATWTTWLDGRDFVLYRDATARWLASGQFYETYQLAGPYGIAHGAVLYPPVALLLFAPFTVLPGVLWWLIPIALIAYVLWDLRPSAIGWLVIAACIAWPATLIKLSTGNPVLWIVAAVALGIRFGWPAVLVLVKPTLAPFAVIGIRRRGWWIAAATLGALSVPFWGMWVDWLVVLGNSRGSGIYYSVAELPMLALPIVADITRTRRRHQRSGRAKFMGLSGIRSAVSPLRPHPAPR